jgi:hypothetical protein
VFVLLADGERFRLDSVRLEMGGREVAHYIYTFKELEALQKGGVQRLFTGNFPSGDHELTISYAGKLPSGRDFNRTERFTFSKGAEPRMLGITLASPDAARPVELGTW